MSNHLIILYLSTLTILVEYYRLISSLLGENKSVKWLATDLATGLLFRAWVGFFSSRSNPDFGPPSLLPSDYWKIIPWWIKQPEHEVAHCFPSKMIDVCFHALIRLHGTFTCLPHCNFFRRPVDIMVYTGRGGSFIVMVLVCYSYLILSWDLDRYQLFDSI
jgi:hypothetical protein